MFFWIGRADPINLEGEWAENREAIAWYAEARPEDIDTSEVFWSDSSGEEQSVELVFQNREPIGSFFRMITRSELSKITAQAANGAVGQPPIVETDVGGGAARKPAKVKKSKKPKQDRRQGELLLPISGSKNELAEPLVSPARENLTNYKRA